MPKFNFGKGKKKDEREEALNKDEELDLETGEEQETDTGFDTDNEGLEEGFFDDDFGIVDSPNDEGDLEDKAREYSAEVGAKPEYKKAEPKWYEKGANIIVVIVIVTSAVVVGLFVFQEPIRGLIGSGTEGMRDLDIQGEVTDYQEGVKDTLQSSDESVAESEVVAVEELDSIPEGEYTVGKDMSAGVWVAKDVLLEIYNTEDEYLENKTPIASNVNDVTTQKIVSMSEGLYIVVQSGELVFNETRPEVAVNVGDTLFYEGDEQIYVGKDIPEGFYTFYNLDILEAEDSGRVRGAKITVANPTEEEPSDFGIERKTTLFLRKGLILTIDGKLAVERVTSDGTYGDDQDLLNETEEDSKEEAN